MIQTCKDREGNKKPPIRHLNNKLGLEFQGPRKSYSNNAHDNGNVADVGVI